jgi:hypothetical protein
MSTVSQMCTNGSGRQDDRNDSQHHAEVADCFDDFHFIFSSSYVSNLEKLQETAL